MELLAVLVERCTTEGERATDGERAAGRAAPLERSTRINATKTAEPIKTV